MLLFLYFFKQKQLERGYGDDSQSKSSSSGEPNEFLKMHAKLRGRVERATAMP